MDEVMLEVLKAAGDDMAVIVKMNCAMVFEEEWK